MPAVTRIIQIRQQRRTSARRNPTGKIGLGCVTLISLLAALTSIFAAFFYTNLSKNLPSIYNLPALLEPPDGSLLQPTRLYDRSGDHVLLTLQNPAAAEREYLYFTTETVETAANPDQQFLPRNLISATLATADPNFWRHPGFSLVGISQGNHPTLAQQLVSDLLLQDEAPGLRRALRERLLAAQVTAYFGRGKVLEWYLNSANYGRLAYGADAAARVYFDKPASELSLAESAMLAAVTKAPAINPLDTPQAALEHQKLVIQDMLRRRVISPAQGIQAAQEELVLRDSGQSSTGPVPIELEPDLAPVFTNLVIQQLETKIPRSELERGGLRVVTTLDYDLQMQVACTTATQLSRLQTSQAEAALADDQDCPAARLLPTLTIGSDSSPPPGLEANAVVLDPQTGQILALVGEPAWRPGTLGLPEHPPGSMITPFIYLTAFTRGLSPATLVWDIPTDDSEFSLQNFDGLFHGPIRTRIALANDYLVPAEKVLAQVGAENVWRTAQQLGVVGSPMPAENDTLGFPTIEGMDLIKISQAFGAFANQGTLVGHIEVSDEVFSEPSGTISPPPPLQPMVIQHVEDTTGRIWLDQASSQSRPVTTPQLAYLMTNVLSDETARWPSLGHPNALEIGRPAAAKVGRTVTEDSTWTVGYTPQLVVGVWIGQGNGDQNGTNQVPFIASAGLWHAIIQYASQDLPYQTWMVPTGISTLEVCDPSGMLPTDDCPNVVNEVFLSGSEPSQTDNLYRAVQINYETGRLATVFTSPILVEDRVYMIAPPEAMEWARNAGLETPPEDYDLIPATLPSWPDVKINSPSMFSIVRGEISIMGQASGIEFAQYRIQVGKGLNPQTWFQVGQDVNQPIESGALGTWDTSSLNGLYALQLFVVRQDQSVERVTILVTVDNQPPEVLIQYPIERQEVTASTRGTVTLQASVEENLAIQSVTFYLDEDLLTTLTQPPFTVPWPAEPGSHTLRVEATDQAGNTSQATVTFSVK